jgi:hypothetical protein
MVVGLWDFLQAALHTLAGMKDALLLINHT